MKPTRLLIAKPGLDGHDRGAKIVVKSLSDAGFEVIYTGPRQTPEMIVATAIQEDVQFIGLSILSGAHMFYFKEVFKLLKKSGITKVIIFGGGTIPVSDIKKLKKAGVDEIFPTGTDTRDIIAYIKNKIK